MREIKFRAWDASEKEWLNDEVGSVRYNDANRLVELKQPIIRFNRGDIILMQYTGLKDKNGVDIYEGDIIDGRRYYRPKLYGRRVVKFTSWGLQDIERWSNDIEVIGNIYENPGLLNG